MNWVKWFDARARILLVSMPFEWYEGDVVAAVHYILDQLDSGDDTYYLLLDVGHTSDFPTTLLTQLAKHQMPYVFIFNAGVHGETIIQHMGYVLPDYAHHFQVANSITHAQLMVYQHRRHRLNQGQQR